MSKLAISLIIKDDSEIKYLKALLRSLKKKSSDTYVTITNEPADKIRRLCDKNGVNYNFFPWVKDFAKARQFGFDNLPEEYDHIFTCDADDIVEGAGNLDRIVWIMEKQGAEACFIPYITGKSKEYGDQTTLVKRLVKRNTGKWVRPIHEVWVQDNPDKFIATKEIKCFHTKEDVKAGEERNLEYLLKIENKTDEDNRYIASSYLTLGDYDKALEYLLKISTDFGFYFNVAVTISSIYKYRRNLKEGVKHLEKLVQIYPDYADAYFKLGEYLIDMKDHQRALDTFLMGFRRPKMTQIMSDSHHDTAINPLGKMVYLYAVLGQREKALWCLEALKKIAPDLKKVRELEIILKEEW